MYILIIFIILNFINLFFIFNNIEFLIGASYLFIFMLLFEFLIFVFEKNLNSKKSILILFLFKNFYLLTKILKEIRIQLFYYVYEFLLIYVSFLKKTIYSFIVNTLLVTIKFMVTNLHALLKNNIFFNNYLFQLKKKVLINNNKYSININNFFICYCHLLMCNNDSIL